MLLSHIINPNLFLRDLNVNPRHRGKGMDGQYKEVSVYLLRGEYTTSAWMLGICMKYWNVTSRQRSGEGEGNSRLGVLQITKDGI